MDTAKKMIWFVGFTLAVSLFSSSLTAFCLSYGYGEGLFDGLGRVCRQVVEECPQAQGAVAAALKRYAKQPADPVRDDFLLAYGYRRENFGHVRRAGDRFVVVGIPAGMAVLFALFYVRRRKEDARIRGLCGYLERAGEGKAMLPLTGGEDELSRLQDEICKTVTMLYQTREEALQSKRLFAENLSNIAHQLKTPITSISLSLQLFGEKTASACREQIGRQLSRLEHLGEALLLLSRLDAGTLVFRKKDVDVFTLLTLAADNLQEIFEEKGVRAEILEAEAVSVRADPEWTMEAVMNLLKNCAEHTPPGSAVHCTYGSNPLYVQIRIWDEGPGFSKEDLPHLFERFYRGANANNEGVGIGLPLARDLLEAQNATLTAAVRRPGGACFELRFYRQNGSKQAAASG